MTRLGFAHWPPAFSLPTGIQVLRAHILPLTNCAFNKSGDKFITGSYDRTCKARAPPSCHSWFPRPPFCPPVRPPSSLTAPLSLCLSVSLSFSHLPQIWDTYSGEEIHTLEGHKNVVYAIAFNNPFGDKARASARGD